MRDWLRDPVEQGPLLAEASGLRSTSGRLYPASSGGWDLRPGTPDNDSVGQAGIHDGNARELSDFDHPHTLTLLHQRALLERLVLHPGDPVLEIGGHRSGVLAWLERHRGVHGAGLDISPAWVAIQNEACAARGGRSSWVLGNAECLPFATNTFAAIVAFGVFEHVHNLRAALEACVRVLRPGGTLICHLPVADIGGSFDGYQRWTDAAAYAAGQASVGHYHERMPTRQQMRTLLEQAGFQVLDTRNFDVWLQPIHDHRLLPALGRLRHRKDKPPKPGAAPPATQTASRYQRAYAAAVIPLARAFTGLDEVGALLGFGGSCSYVAQKPV